MLAVALGSLPNRWVRLPGVGFDQLRTCCAQRPP
jgi:hypothetical protein